MDFSHALDSLASISGLPGGGVTLLGKGRIQG